MEVNKDGLVEEPRPTVPQPLDPGCTAGRGEGKPGAAFSSAGAGMEKCQEGQGFGVVCELKVQNDFRRNLQDEKMGDI